MNILPSSLEDAMLKRLTEDTLELVALAMFLTLVAMLAHGLPT